MNREGGSTKPETKVNQPAGTESESTGALGQSAGTVSRSAGAISKPEGTVSKSAEALGKPEGAVIKPEEQWKAVLHTAQVLTSKLNLDDILESLIKEIMNVIHAVDAGAIMLYDRESDCLVVRKGFGFNMEHYQQIKLKPGEAMSGKTFVTRKPFLFAVHDDTVKGMADISEHNQHHYNLSVSAGTIYPESTISAPLLVKDQCIGVMIISSFSPEKRFTERDLEILETVAYQSAIAIENAKLYAAEQENVRHMRVLHETLQLKNEQLKKAMDIHKKLTHIALQEQGVKAICDTLATLINRQVMLFDDFFELLAISERSGRKEKQVTQEDGLLEKLSLRLHDVSQRMASCNCEVGDRHYFIKPITASHTLLGFIVIADVMEPDQDDLIYMACDLAATVFALEMTKEESVREMHLRMIGNMFNELLQGKWDETLLARIRLVNGGNFESSYVMAVLQIDDYAKGDPKRVLREKRLLIRTIQTALGSPKSNALFVERNERYFILFSFSRTMGAEQAYRYVRRTIERIRQEMQKKRLLFTISGGVGRFVTSAAEIQDSYQDAKACIEYIQTQHRTSVDVIYHELGVNRLFFKNEASELERFVNDVIGPILAYDRANQTDLLATLRAYLAHNRGVQQTAAALMIHKNTLHYRLRKAEELLGAGMEDQGQRWMQVQLALEVREYLQQRFGAE